MRYVVLIGDGMADRPSHGGKTPLQVAETPNMDFIASEGTMGLAKTIPEGFEAGSDIAILSILGYDPRKYYTGRGPLEAIGMGIPLNEGDIVFRCNLVTVENDVITDYSAGHISTEEAKALIKSLNSELKSRFEGIEFHAGVSYRNVLVLRSISHISRSERSTPHILRDMPPPHDVIGANVNEHLPEDEMLREIVLVSRDVLEHHEINEKRAEEGKKKANMIWLWSGGVAPKMPSFKQRYGVGGCVISAVMLVRGIGRCIGLNVVEVPGATGFLDTNYEGKVSHALKCLRRNEFVLVHVEAPDEASHIGDFELKVKAIEDFDRRIVGKFLDALPSLAEKYRILLMPDHATPVSLKIHTSEPVPFAIYDSGGAWNAGSAERNAGNTGNAMRKKARRGFDEKSALSGEIGVIDAKDLMNELLKG